MMGKRICFKKLICCILSDVAAQKKWSFPLRIYSVNVNKSAVSCTVCFLLTQDGVFYKQKQPSKGVLRKRCSKIMQQIYRRNQFSAWVFSCKFLAYFQNFCTEKLHTHVPDILVLRGAILDVQHSGVIFKVKYVLHSDQILCVLCYFSKVWIPLNKSV